MHFAKHRHSRVYLSHATSVTQLWQLSTVNGDPKAAQGTSENGLQGDRWVAAQKPPATASGKGNQPAGGDPESNLGCLGPRDFRR